MAKRRVDMHPDHTPRKGEEWSVDSHMGGSFTVRYVGKGHWKVLNKGWEQVRYIDNGQLFRMETR